MSSGTYYPGLRATPETSWKQAASHATQLALRVFSRLHRLAYQYSVGKIGDSLRGGPILLLTTTGRRSGRDRTSPLSYLTAGDDLIVVASAAGQMAHPTWYLNLLAQPQVTVRVGSDVRTMIARTVKGLERVQLWERLVQQYPILSSYQHKTLRQLPVVRLQPAI